MHRLLWPAAGRQDLVGDIDRATKIFNSPSTNRDALTPELATELTQATRELPGRERTFSKTSRPVGHERAVCGAGDGVLWHSGTRAKEAGYEIDLHSWRRGDDAEREWRGHWLLNGRRGPLGLEHRPPRGGSL